MTTRLSSRALAVGCTLLLGTLMASALVIASAHFNLRRACVVKDTPYFDICQSDDDAVNQKIVALKNRISSAPGDSRAYVELAFAYDAEAVQASSVMADETLKAAIELAPHDPDVLRLQVNRFTRGGKWKDALPLLIQLAEYHLDQNAATVLAKWSSQDVNVSRALASRVQSQSRWPMRVLDALRRTGFPVANVVPLISESIAKGLMTHLILQHVMQSLKAGGHWSDAYGIWMQQNAGALPLLYNASFDKPLRADGFDWELNQHAGLRPGAVAQRMRLSDRGYVLGIQYSGRSIAGPVVRQELFLIEGRYRLDGQYMAEKLRSEKGLTWVARCASDQSELGRSSSLLDSRGNWMTFGFDIVVPRSCVSVVILQLETAASFEATAGFTGRAYFDNLTLVKAGAIAGGHTAGEVVR